MPRSLRGVTGVVLDLAREPDVGIAAVAPPVLTAMGHAKHSLSICDAGPSEVLALIALRASERIPRRTRPVADDNLVPIRSFFDSVPSLFDWHVPEGGVAGYPGYREADGVEAFAARLIVEEGGLPPASVCRSGVNHAAGLLADRVRTDWHGDGSGRDAATYPAQRGLTAQLVRLNGTLPPQPRPSFIPIVPQC